MVYSKEMVEKAEPASLRFAIESELNKAFYRGYDRNKKDAVEYLHLLWISISIWVISSAKQIINAGIIKVSQFD